VSLVNQTRVFATSPLNSTELWSIEVFKLRTRNLIENWKSFRDGKTSFQFGLQKDPDGKVRSTGDVHDFHRVKGLYLDYRVFVANDEPSNFLRVTNIIKKRFRSIEVVELVDRIRSMWKSADGMGAWHGLDFDQISNVLFNASMFHTAQDLQTEYAELLANLDDSAIQGILLAGISFRIEVLKMLHGIVRDTTEVNDFILISLKQ